MAAPPAMLAFLGLVGLHAPQMVARHDTPTGRLVGIQAGYNDGDTLTVDGVRIRLQGVSAPELKQRGGREAATALASLVGNNMVECDLTGESSYGRVVAHCRAGGVDLGAEMVRIGWAAACARYNSRYVQLEAPAKEQRLGAWAFGYRPPEYCLSR